jgi:hypothetical protein
MLFEPDSSTLPFRLSVSISAEVDAREICG